jgi:hypothetical protein
MNNNQDEDRKDPTEFVYDKNDKDNRKSNIEENMLKQMQDRWKKKKKKDKKNSRMKKPTNNRIKYLWRRSKR